jgi:cation diffusion facilitator family transporter
VTWVGVATNLALAALKTAAGWLGHSQALIADGVHSLSDLVSDAVVLFAARHAARAADADHPYGHGRIETAATVFVGALLVATAVVLGRNAVLSLAATSALTAPGLLTLAVAVAAVAAKEALFRYTRRVGRAVHSRLVQANAWHHRSDALSSILVAVGIAGALAGVVTLDAVAALVVAVMIARVGGDLIWQSLRELVDTGLDDASLAALYEAALAVDGVHHVHSCRSRWMGQNALVDLHVRVGARVSVSEGHRIAEAVRLALLERLEPAADVMVHVDPEDDTDGGPSNALPLRSELCARLHAHAAGLAAAERIEEVTLHYLNGRVHVCVTLSPPWGAAAPQAEARALRAALSADAEVGEVSVVERVAPADSRSPGEPPEPR